MPLQVTCLMLSDATKSASCCSLFDSLSSQLHLVCLDRRKERYKENSWVIFEILIAAKTLCILVVMVMFSKVSDSYQKKVLHAVLIIV